MSALIVRVAALGVEPSSLTLPCSTLQDVQYVISSRYIISPEDYFLVQNGHKVLQNQHSMLSGVVVVVPTLPGGKGGFGSMLRAIGAQIEKTTNREACRDLSGRRLRDINEEQRLKKWISQQAERERELEEKRKKKLERLQMEPKHEFKDESYEAERTKMVEVLHESVEEGFKASVELNKRKAEEAKTVPKKKKKLLIDDDLSSSEDSEDDVDVQPSTSSAVSC